jgi:hypothetical protein
MSEMLSLEEAARFIGCCKRAMFDHVFSGRIAPDGHVRFARADLVALRVHLGLSPEPAPAVDPRSHAARGINPGS